MSRGNEGGCPQTVPVGATRRVAQGCGSPWPAPLLGCQSCTLQLVFLFALKKNELLGWDLPPLQGFGH